MNPHVGRMRLPSCQANSAGATAMRGFALFSLVVGLLALAGADASAQQYSLVGNWQGAASFGGLPVTSNAILRADGSFSMLAESQPGLSFNVVGNYTVIPAQQTTTAEDFSLFQRKVPGMFFFLGVTPPGADPRTVAPNHSARFFADEAALVPGMRALSNLAVDFLFGGAGKAATSDGSQ